MSTVIHREINPIWHVRCSYHDCSMCYERVVVADMPTDEEMYEWLTAELAKDAAANAPQEMEAIKTQDDGFLRSILQAASVGVSTLDTIKR